MLSQDKKTEFEPRIVAFLCNWCSYRGADLAGTSRFIEHGKMLKTNREMEDLFKFVISNSKIQISNLKDKPPPLP